LIVFTNENDRKPLNGRKIKCLMERPLVARPFPEEAENNGGFLLYSKTIGRPNGDWDASTHDPIRTEHTLRNIRNMHAATLATTIPIRTPQDLRHHSGRIEASRNAMAVAAMSTGEKIMFGHCSAGADSDGLHSDVEVRSSVYQAPLVKDQDLTFEHPNKTHPPETLQRRDFTGVDGSGSRNKRTHALRIESTLATKA
jgi:hypothetical protein